MSAEANKALVRRYFDEVCNGRKLDVADQLFSANHRYHDPASPTGPGPEGVKQVVSTYQKAFGDARWTVHEVIAAEGDMVIARWNGSGTHSGELMGIAPTKRKVDLSGLWLFRISDGKIVESWDNRETHGMLQQLGVVPAMTQA